MLLKSANAFPISRHDLKQKHIMLSKCLGPVFRLAAVALVVASCARNADAQSEQRFRWEPLPDLIDPHGLAGPFVGVDDGALLVAGGANFPDEPLWESDKVWHRHVYVLEDRDGSSAWRVAGELPAASAYGMSVSLPEGVLCIGGCDATSLTSDVRLLSWDRETGELSVTSFPSLPQACAYGQAALIDNVIYVCGGQTTPELSSATADVWTLDLSERGSSEFNWKLLPAPPWKPRAFNLVASQHNGFEDCLYVMGGRCETGGSVKFLADAWEYRTRSRDWRRRADLPRPNAAGMAIAVGQSHVFLAGGDDGRLFGQADELKDTHPGFPRETFLYHTITDTWTPAGSAPLSQVTTTPVRWGDQIVLASGEVRPRVRTHQVWTVTPVVTATSFGLWNNVVLVTYLAAMVLVGVSFARRNRNANDYFRGGQRIPWWAAGCSIFATMLSSLTFTGIPSKAYAQDWVYAVGNFMIPVVAVFAVFVALPFYRRIDATSAYEYLELRFNRSVRVFASMTFVVFHIFRMAVVMSLTALALAVATPLSPEQSVVLMGVLSILYSVLGGIEAVVWTDTIQAIVLLGGAVVALALLIGGVEGGWEAAWTAAENADKLNWANGPTADQAITVAVWIVVIGAIGQNVSSYTADQAVVQRYVTTKSRSAAARSIWTNAVMSIPATVLFFGIGTALFAYYQTHPQRLDPTITTDQIFPLFIAREMPVGLAGLIVAGVFAAAQSTVSTSMNSTATSVVTDLTQAKANGWSDRKQLRVGQMVTLLVGLLGTGLAIVFVDPAIRSLFDTFIKVVGLFMGVLGGLFLLGILTRRASARGAVIGAAAGSVAMLGLAWRSDLHPFLYAPAAIGVTFLSGYLGSLSRPPSPASVAGLTVFTKVVDEQSPLSVEA